jgi:2-polyprenyl-3-methyl-5-hydroxy-6-metoxy-1,4-benzoquinol methylase
MALNYLWDITTGYSTKSGRYKTKIEKKFIYTYLPNNKLSILDIGGGSGRWAVPFSKEGHDVTVIEINDDALNILRNRDNTINIINKKIEDTTLTTTFDFIIAIEVTDSIDDFDALFSKVNSLLVKNSHFIFSCTNLTSFKYIIKGKGKEKHHYPGALQYRDYLKIINKYNFELIDVIGFYWLPVRINSNSLLVNIFSVLEKIFRLRNWLSQSPELIFCIKKK